ncbi:MAG: PC4/YdbC family ssDNA-binding protein, partial [Oscillospiraceae bacterium]
SVGKNNWERQVNMVSWAGHDPKYDIRDWSPDNTRMGKGISLTAEEVVALKDLLNGIDFNEL